MRILFIFILSTLTITAQAEIHTWVDDNGKKHFSDSLPDHLKHKSSTVDYSSSTPTAAEREEANRIYNQSKKHADGIPTPNRYEKFSITDSENIKKEKHLTRNDKIKLRKEKEAEACDEYLESKRCLKEAELPDGSLVMHHNCSYTKRPNNCFKMD